MNESGEKVETEERRRRSRSGERGGGRGGERGVGAMVYYLVSSTLVSLFLGLGRIKL